MLSAVCSSCFSVCHCEPIKSQWENPNDILSILMIIGGDIVQCAIAQLAGSGPRPLVFAPVAFSFGWVSYALSAILSAVGDGRLLPDPEIDAVLVNAHDGYTHDIKSWPLSRLIRDHHPEEAQREVEALRVAGRDDHHERMPSSRQFSLPALQFPTANAFRLVWTATVARRGRKRSRGFEEEKKPQTGGLHITFYDTMPDKGVGDPSPDWVYHTSVLVILSQVVISAVPGMLHGNWMILITTTGGTLLALASGFLPQWHTEKWTARPTHQEETVCLTKGNGSDSVLVITTPATAPGRPPLLRLHDLANGRVSPSPLTKWATVILFILWIVLLLTVEGLQADAWYSLASGALGMAQNVVAAGAERAPSALGFHLTPAAHVHRRKVFEALQEAERVHPGVGLFLVPVFFPGSLKPHEEEWMRNARVQLHAARDRLKRARADAAPTARTTGVEMSAPPQPADPRAVPGSNTSAAASPASASMRTLVPPLSSGGSSVKSAGSAPGTRSASPLPSAAPPQDGHVRQPC
ncbi:hypothetical protein CERSUDRAFT_127283 [Gelatoporia subvermispora B]|uniref:Uncharacterized protein n=1 Tax=Ceriporiopsis subvermispora (strain B) TaxID=914234 RepID=M2P863_CERS8|nr:hypothetical protein CERSUDRAFT_127283 [Gelatoporia subvermispora B]